MSGNGFCIHDAAILADHKLKHRNSIDVYVIAHPVILHLDVLYLFAHLRFRQANGGSIRSLPAVAGRSILSERQSGGENHQFGCQKHEASHTTLRHRDSQIVAWAGRTPALKILGPAVGPVCLFTLDGRILSNWNCCVLPAFGEAHQWAQAHFFVGPFGLVPPSPVSYWIHGA
jgi:hypothetical protein